MIESVQSQIAPVSSSTLLARIFRLMEVTSIAVTANGHSCAPSVPGRRMTSTGQLLTVECPQANASGPHCVDPTTAYMTLYGVPYYLLDSSTGYTSTSPETCMPTDIAV